MKILVSAIIIALLSLQLYGQEEDSSKRKNAAYLEILGNGVVYSLNYERLFLANNNISPFVRIGGNQLPVQAEDSLRLYLISEAGIIIGKQKNLFDVSLGYTHPLYKYDKDRFIIIRAGFRYTGLKGFLLRLSPMYVINTQQGDVFGNNFWFGLSLGYAF